MTKKTKNIVSDFANNDMPAEVQEQFRCWLDEHAGGEAAEEQLLEEWNAAKLGPVNGAAYEQSFERLMQSMPAASSAAAPKKGRIARLAASWRRMAAVAAVCGVVLGLGALGARLFLKPENGVFVVTGEDSKGRFVLPDGTQVWLNYDSRLYYPESFDGNLRSVRLEGEALFNVVRDASKPFRVRTSLMEVEVLGTVFDLKCYEHLDYAELVLVSGSVKATCAGQLPVTLCPDERLVAYRNSKKIDYQAVDANNYNSKRRNSMRCVSTPFSSTSNTAITSSSTSRTMLGSRRGLRFRCAASRSRRFWMPSHWWFRSVTNPPGEQFS